MRKRCNIIIWLVFLAAVVVQSSSSVLLANATDQRGSVHEYAFDSAGRLGSDAVTTPGFNVDASVLRIGRIYDGIGRLSFLTSYDAAAGGNTVNEVGYTFDSYGNVSASKQAHAGAVDGNTPAVAYTYSDGAANGAAKYIRLTAITYPAGRVVYRNYPASGVVHEISRGHGRFCRNFFIPGLFDFRKHNGDYSSGPAVRSDARGIVIGWNQTRNEEKKMGRQLLVGLAAVALIGVFSGITFTDEPQGGAVKTTGDSGSPIVKIDRGPASRPGGVVKSEMTNSSEGENAFKSEYKT
ncbi:MAG: hypothetical protein HZA50_04025, partial [Planctomycetes bacterium]|nr:hypothetical protein [Planctomycetota bacterium]